VPIVDVAELEKKAKAKEEETKSLPTIVIGGKTYFKGAKGATYDTHGDALDSLQTEKQQAEYKRLGLDETGRSPEQVALSHERVRLLKEKEKILAKAREIDVKISGLKLENFKSKKK